MKSIKTLFSALCIAGLLSLPWYSISSDRDELAGLRRASDKRLYQEVEKALDERISISEKSLKGNIPYVEKVFDGSSIEGEIGVGIKIYKNKKKANYYYFLMATVDKYTDNSSRDNFLLVNDLSFSFDETDFSSKIARYNALGNIESDGRGRGTTFTLDDSVKNFYVGVKYYDEVQKKEGYLIYVLKVSSNESNYVFDGYSNGSVCFQEKIFKPLLEKNMKEE